MRRREGGVEARGQEAGGVYIYGDDWLGERIDGVRGKFDGR